MIVSEVLVSCLVYHAYQTNVGSILSLVIYRHDGRTDGRAMYFRNSKFFRGAARVSMSLVTYGYGLGPINLSVIYDPTSFLLPFTFASRGISWNMVSLVEDTRRFETSLSS